MKHCLIQEQEIKDSVSELTLHFRSSDDGTTWLQVIGPFPYGNRDFYFDKKGKLDGKGTFFAALNETELDLKTGPLLDFPD